MEKKQYYSSKNDIHQRHTEYVKNKSCSIELKPRRCMSLQYLYKILRKKKYTKLNIKKSLKILF